VRVAVANTAKRAAKAVRRLVMVGSLGFVAGCDETNFRSASRCRKAACDEWRLQADEPHWAATNAPRRSCQ
jgi:hypothetical protein